MTSNLLAFGFAGGMEWIVIGLFGIIIFGNRLPSVARGLGRSVTEFKKGLRDIESEVDIAEAERLEAPKSGPAKSE